MKLKAIAILSLAAMIMPAWAFLSPPLSTTSTCRSSMKRYERFGNPFSLLHSELPMSSTTSESDADTQQIEYNWKNVWYPLTYENYIPTLKESAEATPVSIFNEPLVLWRDASNQLHCANDVCPHRSAALSEGRIRDGKLECLYHGWQYSGEEDGACVTIPQLDEKATIPKQACLRMRKIRVEEGIIWVWMGDEDTETGPPLSGFNVGSKEFKDKGFISYDFQIDLPYDHSYLVENLLDPAHIPISHDRTQGGGKREMAQAYDMEVDEESMSSSGFTGRYRNTRPRKDGKENVWTETKFDAPGIIRYRTVNGKVSFCGDLHCIPLGLGRSRLLFRVYFAGLPKFAASFLGIKPLWLRNLGSCKILEEDVGLITTQEDYFTRTGRNLSQDFLLLRTSDLFVGQYRKWLDSVGHGMPWFQGLSRSSVDVPTSRATKHELQPGLDPMNHRASGFLETRLHRFVIHNPPARKALKRIKKLKKIAMALTLASFATSLNSSFPTLLLQRFFSLVLPGFTSLTAFILHRLEQLFYVSHSRREKLRNLKGV
ncbi:hypothetical protein CTEN210_14991 [Chaetoceros tenuissimus]|uniref:Rieske domain-containing protein n=1 Tax=Chaetoceros tenuissimus TaxID=426638 RepID=A0AAD3D815_9STRA|nr:hypothetical protein CTEN210_14991 [Chaetoceros tenuissimus]